MSRNFVPCLVSAALLFISLPVIGQDAQQSDPPAQAQGAPRPPLRKPTNLQVLPKDIASADLTALMRGYNRALGVECTFCHAENPQTHRPDFASDAKPDKTIARTMISMTQEINGKYLSTVKDPDATPADKTVTCGTCHRGNSMPAQFVAGPGGMHPKGGPAPTKPE